MGGNGRGRLVGVQEGEYIKIPCFIRHLYGDSIDMHVLHFKWKSVNFDNLFRNNIFCLQLFVHIQSFLIHVSGIRSW